jgi:hypothetical protein
MVTLTQKIGHCPAAAYDRCAHTFLSAIWMAATISFRL